MSFKEGDTVYLIDTTFMPTGLVLGQEGKIQGPSPSFNDCYYVFFSKEYPNELTPFASLSAAPILPRGFQRICECGVDTLGYGLHSDYCPKHQI